MSSCIGKTALVTDCASGEISRITAIALSEEGAQVLLHSRRPSARVDATIEIIRAAGGRAGAIAGDITETHGPHQLARDVRVIIGDRLDILVINLGPLKQSTVETATVQEFDAQFAANVRGPFFLIQQLLPIMRQGSCIIFTGPSSGSAQMSRSGYSSTDVSIHNLVKDFTAYLAPRNIRVNAITLEPQEGEIKLTCRRKQASSETPTPPGRSLQTGSIGAAIATLVSGDADWINGETLQFNRQVTAHRENASTSNTPRGGIR